MARNNESTNAHYEVASSPVSSVDGISFAGWFYHINAVGSQSGIVTLLQSSSYATLEYNQVSNRVRVTYYDGFFTIASSTTTVEDNVWAHAGGRLDLTGDEAAAFLNGGGKGTSAINASSGDITPDTIQVFNTNSARLEGYICEVGIWNTLLTDQEFDTLAKGFSPETVQPGSLVGTGTISHISHNSKIIYPIENTEGQERIPNKLGLPIFRRSN
jgi:hypothetical protein